MAGNHEVGEIVDLRFRDRYVSSTLAGDATKVVYSPESDRMKHWYDYYIFDASSFHAAIAELEEANKKTKTEEEEAEGGGGHIHLTFKVVAKRNTMLQLDDDQKGAQPEGGFSKTFYECDEFSFVSVKEEAE
jgi:hypothetical protein